MDKKMIAATAVVLVVVIAGASAFFMLSGKDAPKDEITIDDLAKTGNYLKIFGNANGDYLLDNDDVKIIQDYIDGKTDKKDLLAVQESDNKKNFYLADANCDGVVDKKDIDVLKGIIDRSGEYMNIIDTFGHLLKVPLKIDRIACDYFATAEILNMVGVQDKIVGASKALIVLGDYYLSGVKDISKVVNFNSRTGSGTDFEALAKADPQVWVVSEDYGPKYAGNTNAVVIGLDTLVFDFDNILASSPIMSALLAGYIFNQPQKGIDYVDWYLKTWNMLNDKTKDLKAEDRPTVFYTGYGGNMKMDPDTGKTIETDTLTLRYFPVNTVCWQAVQLAGGHNLIDDYPTELKLPGRPTSNVSMDLEWITVQKFDYLFSHCTKYTGSGTMSAVVPDHGYLCDDPSEYRTAQDSLSVIGALKGCDPKNMYLTPGDFMNGASGGLMSAIMVATVIHPDLFPDLDLNEEFQKFIDLMGFDYDVSKHGTFFLYNE
ncbi:MAG: ABC transporter substrate-binding protein [archaeon]|nr:ABC transporter substrate-binding protein [archaeon]